MLVPPRALALARRWALASARRSAPVSGHASAGTSERRWAPWMGASSMEKVLGHRQQRRRHLRWERRRAVRGHFSRRRRRWPGSRWRVRRLCGLGVGALDGQGVGPTMASVGFSVGSGVGAPVGSVKRTAHKLDARRVMRWRQRWPRRWQARWLCRTESAVPSAPAWAWAWARAWALTTAGAWESATGLVLGNGVGLPDGCCGRWACGDADGEVVDGPAWGLRRWLRRLARWLGARNSRRAAWPRVGTSVGRVMAPEWREGASGSGDGVGDTKKWRRSHSRHWRGRAVVRCGVGTTEGGGWDLRWRVCGHVRGPRRGSRRAYRSGVA